MKLYPLIENEEKEVQMILKHLRTRVFTVNEFEHDTDIGNITLHEPIKFVLTNITYLDKARAFDVEYTVVGKFFLEDEPEPISGKVLIQVFDDLEKSMDESLFIEKLQTILHRKIVTFTLKYFNTRIELDEIKIHFA